MTWDWKEIESQWLNGSKIAFKPDEVVHAFSVVEEVLGLDWITSHRISNGTVVSGTSVVLPVVFMGKKILALRGAKGFDALIKKIRKNDRATHSEMDASYLCCRDGKIDLEFFVEIVVGERKRVPDFRLTNGEEPWVYAEVTSPDMSEIHREVAGVMNKLIARLPEIPNGNAVEIYLLRDPMTRDIDRIEAELMKLNFNAGPVKVELPGLALFLVGHTAPGQIVTIDHDGVVVPRLGKAQAVADASGPLKHLAVRYPYSDRRAENFLKKESHQLPEEFPGIIFVDVSNAPGAMKSWEPLLRRRFQPQINTRVSAVCLFSGGMVSSSEGETIKKEAKLVENPHAKRPLPSWLIDRLRKA